MVKWLAIVTAATIAAACALVSQGPPENKCASDQDCFHAQGEVCDLSTHRCVPGPDAGVPMDAPPDQ